jgi:hypothetical protein
MNDELNMLLASALRMAALELEAMIAAGDVADVAAPVEGESGRAAAVEARDEIYNDPAGWLRERADMIEAIPEEHDEDICSGGFTMCHECYAAGEPA